MKSIIQSDPGICHLCGGRATQTHHIFGAANRKWSDAYGLTIRVCARCHDAIHFEKDSGSLQRMLHEEGQRAWEDHYGDRQAFMNRFGRNYL